METRAWERVAGEEINRLPREKDEGRNTVGESEEVVVRMTEEETESLLREVAEAYRTQVNDILLTALGIVLTRWVGSSKVLVDVEGHGREEEEVDGVDMSRTVGWFTVIYPVCLEIKEDWGLGERIKRVKEQLRGVPGGGIGYGD